MAGEAVVTSVSCASAGNCSAGAYHGNRSGQEAFVAAAVDQRGRQATTLALWPFQISRLR